LSSFALRAVEVVPPALLANVLINLGRLDWRRNNGDTGKNRLLERVWQMLDGIKSDGDPRLDAVRAVALYQPRQALDFVGHQYQRGRPLYGLAEILRRVAHGGCDFGEVAKLLWAVGRTDRRELDPNPGHPMRILAELGAYNRRKPLRFSEDALTFGLKLADDASNWGSHYTPLDVLRPLLSTEGVDTRSDDREFVMTAQYVAYAVVEPLRAAVLTKVLALLRHSEPRIARLAAEFFDEALRAPIGVLGSEPPPGLAKSYSVEFEGTLRRILAVLQEGVSPPAALAIARTVAHHARHWKGTKAKLAKAILNDVPDDLGFRLRGALADGFGRLVHESDDVRKWQAGTEAWLAAIVRDVTAAMPNPARRRAYIGAALDDLAIAGEARGSAYVLVHVFFAKTFDLQGK